MFVQELASPMAGETQSSAATGPAGICIDYSLFTDEDEQRLRGSPKPAQQTIEEVDMM